jgi:nucleoside-diphosphate-sugar epimerase
MMRVLITGISGFIGTNLSSAFKKSEHINIIGLDIQVPKNKNYDDYYSWSNINDIDWSKIDCIIHLTGMAHDTQGTANESQYYEINVGLTKLIYEYYLNSSATRFIHFSSVKAVADTVTGDILTEDDHPIPMTPYGRSKLEAEVYLLSRELPTEKRLYIFRPAMIHGPGNKGNLNLLYSVLKSGIPYPLGAYDNKRSFTSIQNLLFIVESFLQSDILSGIYNVCDDEPLSTIDIAVLINQSLGRSGKIWNIPKILINGLAKIGDLLHLPFNSARLQKLTATYIVSNAKLKLALQRESLPTQATVGLLNTLRSFSA